MKINLFLLIVILASISCCAQEKSVEFQKVISLFPEAKIPLKYKTGIIGNTRKKIAKKDAIKYFHYSEDDLKMNDFGYNYDEDIQYDNWVEVLPVASFKLTDEKYIALTCALLKSPKIGHDIYKVLLTTFTYQGGIIDSITIRSQYTPETDWRDFVFIKNNMFRIFDYMPNMDNYNIKGGAYYIIDEKQAKTVVEINDYQIDENGKINLIKTHPKKYLKEFISFYRSYHKDSDDPMNEY